MNVAPDPSQLRGEPDPATARLTPVTAQTQGADRVHETHDRLLVARFATDDALAPDEVGAVRALLASCPDCSALVPEMRLLVHATSHSLAPARPRDFRLTAEQAAGLRPGAWQRFLARFSAPRATALRPLAGAALAIGLVLAGVGGAMPASTAPADEQGAKHGGAELRVGGPSPNDSTSDVSAGDDRSPATLEGEAQPVAMASPRAGAPLASGAAEMFTVDASPGTRMVQMEGGPAATETQTALLDQVSDRAVPLPEEPGPTGLVAEGRANGDALAPALIVLGLLLAVSAALVLLLGWLSRRATDPLLR